MRGRNSIQLLKFQAWFLLTASAAWADGSFQVVCERDVAVKMRDGVVLTADVYRPKAEGKFPVLLARTPYDKANTRVYDAPFGIRGASQGYVVIIQDARGRFTSKGDWYPFKHESQDGYDTVEWAASQPYSNGKVGMFGASYLGITQLLAALAQPPHLAGISPVLAPSDLHDGTIYQGGAFEQGLAGTWTPGLAVDSLNRQLYGKMNVTEWIWKLPLVDYPMLEVPSPSTVAPYFRDWLSHPSNDDYWKAWSVKDQPAKVSVPAYHVGGWYDIFMGGTLDNYMSIRKNGGTETARHGQRLLIGPWCHCAFDGKPGDADFGPQARMGLLAEDETFRWYDHLLKGLPNGIEGEKPVRIFVMGKNIWREEDDWPLARARATRYYLHSGGKANSLRGDGMLSAQTPRSEPAESYVYDPADPVPTRGGGLCCNDTLLAPGVRDQRPNEARDDVLIFSTAALQEDFEVTGPISLELYASSSAVDTDFAAKLVDVWPNGFVQNLTDGILRARYRKSQEKAELMNPGEIYRLTIDLWATSNVFLKDHRLRLEVSSSNFPRFDRNLNTGEDQGRGTRMAKATNKIYHDGEHPSALVLPVIPN